MEYKTQYFNFFNTKCEQLLVFNVGNVGTVRNIAIHRCIKGLANTKNRSIWGNDLIGVWNVKYKD